MAPLRTPFVTALAEIGVGAAASLVAAHGTSVVSDLDAVWWLERGAVTGGMRYEGATVVLPRPRAWG